MGNFAKWAFYLYFYELYTIFKEFCHSIFCGIFRHFMPVWKFLATFWLQCPVGKYGGIAS